MTTADMAPGKLVLDPASAGVSTLRYARKFGFAVVLLALAFGAASFLILLGLTPVTAKTVMNYTLELAPPAEHPKYLSTMQLAFLVPFVFSPVAGAVINTGDGGRGVAVLIALVLVALLTAFGLTFGMRETRKVRSPGRPPQTR